MRESSALLVGAEYSSDIRPFTPCKAARTQIDEHRFDKLGPAPSAIQIIAAEDERSADLARPGLSGGKCLGVAEVQIAGGRRSEPAPIAASCSGRGVAGHRSERSRAGS